MNRYLLAFTALAAFVLSSLSLSAARLAAQDAPPAARQLLRLTLRGEVFESDPPFQIFGSALGVSLRDALQAIHKARQDDKVAGLVVRLKEPVLGWTQLQALRRALIEFRGSGKPSFCHLDSASSSQYLLASACGEVSLQPSGFIEIPGLRLDLLHLKGLLDKVGIEFQELRMGRYKGAAEPFTRESPSEAMHEQLHSLLDDLFEDYVASLAENRSLKPVAARALIDRALYSAAEAKDAGLVDRLEHEDEFLERLRGEGDGRKLVDQRLGRQLEIDLSGFAGMMKLVNELFGGKRQASSRNPKIAIVYGLGPIITSSDGPSLFGGAIMTSDEMVKIFRQVRQDDTVQAVVFRVDSPGGSALASDLILREVKLTAAKKPVVVSMGDVAASGGYYVSCGATRILAEKGTITGSIGVIGALPSLRGLSEKIGLSLTTFSRGKRAGMITAYGEMTEEGRAVLMKLLRRIYDDFIDHVAAGRKMSRDAVESIAEGRIWSGEQALRLGLIDELGGLDIAMARARELSGAPASAEILVLPRPKELIDFLRGMSGEDAALRAAVRALPADLRRLLRQAGWIAALGKERALAVLPEAIRVR
jgi:protease-4